MMRAVVVVMLSIFLVFLVFQIISYGGKQSELTAKFDQIKQSFDRTKSENEGLKSDYDYYQNSANLEKELRARFNYRRSDEKMIIIVPKPSSTQP